ATSERRRVRCIGHGADVLRRYGCARELRQERQVPAWRHLEPDLGSGPPVPAIELGGFALEMDGTGDAASLITGDDECAVGIRRAHRDRSAASQSVVIRAQ